MANRVKTVPIAFRLNRELVGRLRAATEQGNFRLSQTAIVERGLELVLKELDADAKFQLAHRAKRK